MVSYKSKPVILDLCGGTGAWSMPYAESGRYDVKIIDPQEWLPDDPGTGDVRLYEFPGEVHGVLAAPPCTHLSSSGARWWEGKGEGALLEALSVVDACMRIILVTNPKWWALENPVGRLRRFIGPPTLIFDPCDFGDPYTKKTLLWGSFKEPERSPVKPEAKSRIHWMAPGPERARMRSKTPQGFAKAFYEANP